MQKRKIRIIEIEGKIKTNRSYASFKKEFPDFKYNRKTRTYTLPKKVLKEIIIKAEKKKFKTIKIVKAKKKQKIGKAKKEKEEKPQKRIRQQVAFNFRSHSEPYHCSIRALTLNPEYTQRGLLIAVQEVKRDLEQQGIIDFDEFSSSYLGFEEKEISNAEDKILNDGKIHVEVFIKNKGRHFTK